MMLLPPDRKLVHRMYLISNLIRYLNSSLIPICITGWREELCESKVSCQNIKTVRSVSGRTKTARCSL